MAKQGTGRGCVFCDGKPLSLEHVWPEWMRPYLVSPDGPGTSKRMEIRSGERTWSREREAHPADVKVKSVCARCNNGWMSRIETNAKTYLTTMVKGHGRTYHEGGQERIATWATKTALMAGSRFKPRIPESFYRDFHATQLPSAGTRVWLGATSRPYMTFFDVRPLKASLNSDPPVDRNNGYAAFLCVAHLALYVFARESSEPPSHEFGRKFGRAFRPIWPFEGKVTFPPPLILSFEDLNAVADTIGKPRKG